MDMIQITCPHCGFQKDVPSDRIPATKVSITCPQCRQQFEFGKAAIENGVLAHQPPLPPSVEPVAAVVPTERITCPECGFSKELPTGKVPSGTSVTCPSCRQAFIFKAGAAPAATAASKREQTSETSGTTPSPQQASAAPRTVSPTKPPPKPRARKELSSVGELFTRSWDSYRQKIGTLIVLFLLALLPQLMLAAILFTLSHLFPQIPHNDPRIILVAFPVLIIFLIPLLWLGGASLFIIAGAADGLRDALGKAWPKLGSFCWLSFVYGFIILGGFLLFFLPGIIFTIWFLFAPFILVLEDRRGMNALLQSKAFVRGDFKGVIFCYLPAWLISAVIGMIPVVGPFLTLAYMPFLLIYTFEMYRDLREMKGEVRFADTVGEKCKWLGAGALGYLVIPVIAVAFMGSLLFSLIPTLKSLVGAKVGSDTGNALQLPSTPMLESMAATLESDPEPVEVSAAEYEALLSKEQIAFEPGKGLSLGPAALLLDHFWEDKKSPHFWLKLRVAPLPNSVINSSHLARIVITHVWDKDNKDFYDPANNFESDIFQSVSLSAYDAPYRHMGGLRDVHLQTGISEKDLSRISGELILQLPVKIATIKLDPSQKGKELSAAGATITLKELGDKKVSLDYRGDYRNFVRIVGYGPDGKPVGKAWDSKNTNGDVTALQVSYSGDVTSAKIMIAAEVLERKYPFEIKK